MPSDVRYAIIKRLLESNGWSYNRTTGSHHVFTGTNRRTFSVPVHRNKVKHVYYVQAQKAVEEARRKEAGPGPSV